MKRILLSIITVFCLFAQSLSAQTYVQTNKTLENAEISIKFYNRTLYYPGSGDENPIYVHITIRNTGADTLRFKLADDRAFSLDFKAVDAKNIKLPESAALTEKRTTSQTVYFRELALEPAEEYSFVENIKDYLDITNPSIYYLTATFYPELFRNKSNAIESKRLSLEVRPSPTIASSSYIPVETGTASILEAEAISPDKVVEQTIIARQQGAWDKFFLYMDVEAILKNNTSRNRRYNAASADERIQMLQQFKADLMQSRIDTDIVSIPSKFEIETTTYSQTQGTVKVLEWFRNTTFTEKKRYTYYVRQRDGIWQIYNYTVDNLGTQN
ncbi:MAG: hypothetical protein IKQ43_09575 [Treponema sp.]|nr:hypothetical protein [Treponema sp.]